MSKDFIDYYGPPNYKKAKWVANLLIEKLKIDLPVKELRRVINFFELKIEEVGLLSSGEFNFNEKIISISYNDANNRQYFTIAHELGHYMLHQDYCKKNGIKTISRNTLDRNNYDSLEKEANVFAAYFLVPTSKLKVIYDDKKDLGVNYLAHYFGVSREVIENRINSLRIEGLI